MAGIGDYIHYKLSNYRKFGTTKEGPSNYESYDAIFQQQRKYIKNHIISTQSQQLTDIETFLTNLFYKKPTNGGRLNEEAYNELVKRVNTMFEQKHPSFKMNIKNAGGTSVTYKGQQEIKADRKKISVSKIEEYLRTITGLVDGSIKINKLGQTKENQALIKKTKDDLQNYLNSVKDTTKKEIKIDKSNISLFDDINTVLKFQSLPYAMAIGDIFEIWLALASDYAGGRAVDLADEFVEKNLIKGSSRSTPIISLNNFSDEYVSAKKLMESGVFSKGWQRIDENNSFQMTAPTQDKLDVVFEWNGDTLNVSAKNYSLNSSSSMIHLVSGTSLLYLISNENADFVNHWLNLVAANSDGEGDNLSAARQAAHIEMKLTILMKALTGQGLGQSGVSDTFILNARSQGKVYVRSMSSIINNIEKLIGSGSEIRGIHISNYPNTISNTWVGSNKSELSESSALERISNLIAQLHTYKISVEVSPEALTGEKLSFT